MTTSPASPPTCAASRSRPSAWWTRTGNGSSPASDWRDANSPRRFFLRPRHFGDQASLVVPDTLEDARFADNPLVTSPTPHLRLLCRRATGHPEGHAARNAVRHGPEGRLTSPGADGDAPGPEPPCHRPMEMRHAAAGQALVLSRWNRRKQEGKRDYQAVCAQAAAYMFETAPDKAYLSSDAALARLLRLPDLRRTDALLDDI